MWAQNTIGSWLQVGNLKRGWATVASSTQARRQEVIDDRQIRQSKERKALEKREK